VPAPRQPLTTSSSTLVEPAVHSAG
jgi:hypothetical protein